jgi:hypothetical protein
MYRLEPYEKELQSTPRGRAISQLIDRHMGEVNWLINNNREVMVTWQRNKGPLFFSQFMATGFNAQEKMTKEIDGIPLGSLIRRMAVVLQDHGSPSLVQAIDEHLLLVLAYAHQCDSLHQIFQNLQADENKEATEN